MTFLRCTTGLAVSLKHSNLADDISGGACG
jgi:hypothetical protein